MFLDNIFDKKKTKIVPIIEAIIYQDASNVLPKTKDFKQNNKPSPRPSLKQSLFLYKKNHPKNTNQNKYNFNNLIT